MFRVCGMGEPGAVSGVAGWGMLVRFGAGSGPPARGVLLDFAHFGAAAVGAGFGARAVADRCGSALQCARRVCQRRPGPRRQRHDAIKGYESQGAPESRDPSRAERGAIHGQSLRPCWKKTDRTARQKMGITRVLGPGSAGTRTGGFPTRAWACAKSESKRWPAVPESDCSLVKC